MKCPECHATGEPEDEECWLCEGTGRLCDDCMERPPGCGSNLCDDCLARDIQPYEEEAYEEAYEEDEEE